MVVEYLGVNILSDQITTKRKCFLLVIVSHGCSIQMDNGCVQITTTTEVDCFYRLNVTRRIPLASQNPIVCYGTRRPGHAAFCMLCIVKGT